MTTSTLIKLADNGEYWYQHPESRALLRANPEQIVKDLTDAIPLCLLIPAEQGTLKTYDFDAAEEKLLRQTISYNLEEALSEDVDDLHFALGESHDQQVPVAIVKKSIIENCLADFAEQGAMIDEILPEIILLPWLDMQWTLAVDSSDETSPRYLLRYASDQGFALPEALFVEALKLLINEQGLPESLVLYCEETERQAVMALLPDALKLQLLWQSANYFSLLSESLNRPAEKKSRLSFLQGSFSVSLPWQKWWQLWRGVAILALVYAGLQLTYLWADNVRLQDKNLALRSATESAYRQAIPKGAVIDPERQLRRKVAALQGGGGEGFVSLLSKVAEATTDIDGFDWQMLNYAEKNNELRITVLAKSFQDVEQVRSQLQKQGLTAELTGSSSDNDKTRARLRIRG